MKIRSTYWLIFLLFPFAVFAQLNSAEKVKGVIYLKLNEQAGQTERKALNLSVTKASSTGFKAAVPLKKSNPKVRAGKSILDGLYRVDVDESTDIDALVDSLSKFSNVIYAEPVYQEKLLYTPNDPEITNGNQPYLEVVRAYQAWDITKGSDKIRIGIIDTGIDLDHEDLADKIYINHDDPINGIDDDANGYIDDYQGYDLADNDPYPQADNSAHGIRVCGLAGASTDNDRGIAGVGYNSMLVPLKVFKSEGNVAFGSYEAIIYAADNGVDIINISWGSTDSYSKAAQDIINYAVLEKDVVVIAAAGNQNTEDEYFPASYDHVLSVGSTNNADEKAGFSSYNYAVDLMAPGDNIFSTNNNDTYGSDNGTSYSTPLVAGAASLVKTKYPNLSALQIMELLRVTADDIYATGSNQNYFGKLGKGRLNIEKALTETRAKALRAENFQFSNDLGPYAFFDDTIHLSFDVVSYLHATRNATIRFSSPSKYAHFLINEIPVGELDTLAVFSVNQPVLALDPKTPPQTEIPIRLGFSDESYEDFQYFSLKTEPDYVNIGNSKLKLTMAGNGSLGFAEDQLKNGIGMEWNNNQIATTPGFMVALASGQVSDNLPLSTAGNSREHDFAVKKPIKLSRSEVADLMAKSTFTDHSASSPIGLLTDQRAFAYEDKDFLILEYRLVNTTTDTLKNVVAGLFVNWNLPEAGKNRSFYDSEIRTLLTFSNDMKLFTGIKCFLDTFPVYQALDINDNDGNTIDLTDLDDETKFDLAFNLRYDSAGMHGDGNDIANLLAQDSIIIPPNTSNKATFFIALADSRQQLATLMDEADSAYQKILSLPPLLETFYSCKGATITVNPAVDSLFRFYSDPYAKNLIGEGNSLSVGPISGDTSIYAINVDNNYEGEIQRLDVRLVDNVASFSMSTDTLFLDSPQLNNVTFVDESFLPESWEWDFDNGLKATLQKPTVNFTSAGTYEISLYVENTLGCSGRLTRELLVANRPEKPAIADMVICKNEPVEFTASNTDSIAVYLQLNDTLPIRQTPDVRFEMIPEDTCFYVTNITGPFESLKKEVCIRVEFPQASFTYAPDTTSPDNKVVFTNTSADADFSKWYVDGVFIGTEPNPAIEVTKADYEIALVNQSGQGCRDSVMSRLKFGISPIPVPMEIITCYGRNVAIHPEGGEYFAFYADPGLDSLIKKGKSITLDSVVNRHSIYVTGLDSILPSPIAELSVGPENITFSIKATPDTLILSQERTARFTAISDSLMNWVWYKNGQFQESIRDPLLFFDSAGVYELALHAETLSGCSVTDTLQYLVLHRPVETYLNISRKTFTEVYPNPSSGVFEIEYIHKNATVRVIDSAGKEVKRYTPTSGRLTIDISAEKEGIYFLQILDTSSSEIFKIRLIKDK